jgi:hypothetical protein
MRVLVEVCAIGAERLQKDDTAGLDIGQNFLRMELTESEGVGSRQSEEKPTSRLLPAFHLCLRMRIFITRTSWE